MKRSGVTNVTGEPPMPSDLAKRGSTYYFRRAVPESLRPYFLTARGAPRTEFMESLGTKDLATAKERARLRGVEVDALLRDARAKQKAGSPVAAIVRSRSEAREQYEIDELDYREERFFIEDDELEAREPLRRQLIASLSRPLDELSPAQRAMRDLIDDKEFDPPEVKAKRIAEEELAQRKAEAEVAAWFERYQSGTETAVSYPRVVDMFEGYAAEAQLAHSTYKRWRPVMDSLVKHLGHDDAARISQSDIVSWKDALLRERDPKGVEVRGARTVREVFLAASKAVFNWGVSNGRIQENPADKVSVRVKPKARLRDPGFTDEEANRILRATLLPQSEKLGRGHALARRWVPWICAYTGARVNEITQLRAQDVTEIAGVWTIRITPEAGSQKSNEARVVPLHSHLVEQGFPAVAQARGQGPIFFEPERGRGGGPQNPHYKKVGERLAAWVRSIGIEGVQPNHAWRHRFKTVARNVAMDLEARNAIPGHAPGTEGQKYGINDVPFLSREIEKLPRLAP